METIDLIWEWTIEQGYAFVAVSPRCIKMNIDDCNQLAMVYDENQKIRICHIYNNDQSIWISDDNITVNTSDPNLFIKLKTTIDRIIEMLQHYYFIYRWLVDEDYPFANKKDIVVGFYNNMFNTILISIDNLERNKHVYNPNKQRMKIYVDNLKAVNIGHACRGDYYFGDSDSWKKINLSDSNFFDKLEYVIDDMMFLNRFPIRLR